MAGYANILIMESKRSIGVSDARFSALDPDQLFDTEGREIDLACVSEAAREVEVFGSLRSVKFLVMDAGPVEI